MPLLCPRCTKPLNLSDVNVATDAALCRACGSPLLYSEVLHGASILPASHPPTGAWRLNDGDSLRLGATCRSWAALPLIGVALFWNGIVGTFVVVGFTSGNHWVLLFISLHAAVGIGIVWAVLLMLFGRIEITLRGASADVFTGIGPVGRRLAFDPTAVKRVRRERSRKDDSNQTAVVIEADRQVKFGSLLSDVRREWLLAALSQTLMAPSRTAR